MKAVPKANGKWLEVMKIARPLKNKVAVPFYGCMKCRYNRKGCFNYKCNPQKFEARFAKFPEFYAEGTKELLNAEFIKMSAKDLTGGETRLCAHSQNKTNKNTNKHTTHKHINT